MVEGIRGIGGGGTGVLRGGGLKAMREDCCIPSEVPLHHPVVTVLSIHTISPLAANPQPLFSFLDTVKGGPISP